MMDTKLPIYCLLVPKWRESDVGSYPQYADLFVSLSFSDNLFNYSDVDW